MQFQDPAPRARVSVGQVWLDTDRKYRPRRFIRIEQIEQRGLWRIARIVARQGTEPWHAVTRFIRLDRIAKRFQLQNQEENNL